MGGYHEADSNHRVGDSPTGGVTMLRPTVNLAVSETCAVYAVYPTPDWYSGPFKSAPHLHLDKSISRSDRCCDNPTALPTQPRMRGMEDTTPPIPILVAAVIRNRSTQVRTGATVATSPRASRSPGSTR